MVMCDGHVKNLLKLLTMVIFHGHVKLPEGNANIFHN